MIPITIKKCPLCERLSKDKNKNKDINPTSRRGPEPNEFCHDWIEDSHWHIYNPNRDLIILTLGKGYYPAINIYDDFIDLCLGPGKSFRMDPIKELNRKNAIKLFDILKGVQVLS